MWFLVAVALAGIGLGVSHSLSPSVVVVPSSEAAAARQLAESNFGPGTLVPILLEGPKAQLDRQGPALAKALVARRDTRVLSAWDVGEAGESLRPDATHAMLVTSVAQTERAMVDGVQDDLDQIIDRTVAGPVKAHVSGTPTINMAMGRQALDEARLASLLALPILLGVLLLVLRAPVAALLLTGLAGATTLLSFGAMALLGTTVDGDATAITLASMAGMALGVGYALLVYRRWRDERSRIDTSDRAADTLAAVTAIGTTGQAVLVGGTALALTLVIATLVGPTTILISLGIGLLLCSLLAIGGAVVILPAGVSLLGDRLETGLFPLPRVVAAPWRTLADRGGWVVRHAVPAGAMARIGVVMGPGFATPFEIVVASTESPITDRAMLRKLDTYQARLASDNRVDSVVGPGNLYTTSRELRALPKQLNGSKKMLKSAPAALKKLETGLGTAGSGSKQLQSGLSSPVSGAQQLASGTGQASSGSAQLDVGLAAARAGAAKISAGLGAALSGAQQLQDGAGQLRGGTGDALAGARQIAGGLGQAVGKVKPRVPVVQGMANDVAAAKTAVGQAAGSAKSAAAQIAQGAAQLHAMTTGTDDPAYGAAVAALDQAAASAGATSSSVQSAAGRLGGATAVSAASADQIVDLSSGLSLLYGGSQALSAGIAKLNAGAAKLQTGQGDLAAGIGQLNQGGGSLTSGLSRLSSGSGQLEQRLDKLAGGSSELASGLGAAPGKIDPLIGGPGEMQVAVAKFRGELPSAKDIERLQASSPGLFDSGHFVLAAVAGARAGDRNQAASVVNLQRGATAGRIMVVPEHPVTAPVTRALGEDLTASAERFAAATGTETAVGCPAGAIGDFATEGDDAIWPVIAASAVAVLLLLVVTMRAVVLPVVAVAFDLLTAGATLGVLAFLYSGDDPPLGGPGFIDPVAILLDALVVRPLLLPAAVAPLGPRVWWPRAPRASCGLRHRSAMQAGT
jgi:X-X-X-Leu-X-X-Gly heptad repeat protein